MSFSAQDVKKLREMTGVGMMDAHKALTETAGDLDKAVEVLRKSSAKTAAKKIDRVTREGLVISYIHPGSKLGVLLEVNCETDFVARTDDFAKVCHDVAMHIAAAAPVYLTPDEVPADVVAKEREIYLAQLDSDPKDANKPADIKQKIIDGRVQKFLDEQCLMLQRYVKDDSVTVTQFVEQAIARIGEKIKIARFTRYSLGA